MRERAQLVLAAAAVVAVALAPIVLAHLQLGYHADVRATGDYGDPTTDARRVLDRAVASASADIPARYAWTQRAAAATRVRDRLRPRLDRLRTARVREGTLHRVTYNTTAARTWRQADCPSGPDRQFGRCTVDRGVVLQNRTGRTHVLGVGLDVRTATQRGHTTVTVVVSPADTYRI